jgi:formate transporter
VALGYQHSIANFFLVPIGLFYGTNFGVGKFIYQSVIPVTLGNIVGGALFCGTFLWFLYGRDTTLAVETGQPLSGEDKRNGVAGTHHFGNHGSDGHNDEAVTAGGHRDRMEQGRGSENMV